MNPRYSLLVLTLATFTAPAVLTAQTAADPAAQYQTQQPAPVERSSRDNGGYATRNYGRRQQPANNIVTTQPATGIFVRTTGTLDTVTAQAGTTELRLTSGIANVNVHHSAKDSLIQVDLPGGQVNLLKDGLYTFNANTNTVRVLKGEAQTTVAGEAKPIKIKEDHDFVFGGSDHKAHEFYPVEARADLLPLNAEARGEPAAYYGYGPYGSPNYGGYYAPYGYGYPYAAYGYGYPYGWGPSFGLGFGYYGGFGGYRGFGGRGFRR